MSSSAPVGESARHRKDSGIVARMVAMHAELFRIIRHYGWPLVDVGIRIALAQSFLAAGVASLSGASATLQGFARTVAVAWMSPDVAASIGATAEVLGAVLLAVGLLTRPAALSMLVLALFVQASHATRDSGLFMIGLLGWYVVRGADRISFDEIFGRGLRDSALPLAASVGRLTAWMQVRCAPLYLGLLRIWMGAALVLASVQLLGGEVHRFDRFTPWIPIATASSWPSSVALIGGVMLALGLLTRYAAIALFIFDSGMAMMHGAGADAMYLAAAFALLVVQGAGIPAVDRLVETFLRRRYPQLDGRPAFSLAGLPRVVVIGAGFGGLACAAGLRRARASVILIDRVNHHLFQPLLYQVATASLSPGDIAAPIRPMFRDCFNTSVLFGEVTGIDTSRRQVQIGDAAIPYDHLVIATGAAHSYFGKDEWQAFAPGLKRIEDATEIRRRLLTAFERAEGTDDEEERRALLTFLIVGGGPTGVELAGSIAELARYGMEKDFRKFDPATARIVLVQSAPRILPTFEASMSEKAMLALERLGVEICVGSRVEHIDGDGVVVAGQHIAARTVLWAAGVAASPAAAWLGAEADASGRIRVGTDLRVPGLADVYAIGDTAFAPSWKGAPVPGLAPAAKQAGAYVARAIEARLQGEDWPMPFAYRHLGSLATIGRKAAVADFGWVRLSGAPAWWLWGLVHVGFLVGVRNRMATMTNWFWAYLTFGAGIRLITGASSQPGTEKSQ